MQLQSRWVLAAVCLLLVGILGNKCVMAIYTTEDADTVDGGIAAGIWRQDTNAIAIANSQQWVGFQFATPVTLSAGDGFGNSGHSTIAPIGFSSATVSFVEGISAGVPVTTFTAYVEAVPDADPWTTASSPVDRVQTAISDPLVVNDADVASGSTISLPVNAAGLAALNSVIRSSRYRGSLFISVKCVFEEDADAWQIVMSEDTTNDPPTLTTIEFADHTGFLEFDMEKGRGRATHDDRRGMPIFSGDLVEDSEQKGLWVEQRDHDIEDPKDTYRPKPNEGGREPGGRP